MTIEEILKEQDKKFKKLCEGGYGEWINALGELEMKCFIQKFCNEIVKAVCEEMIGKIKNYEEKDDQSLCDYKLGYNNRVQEEKEKVKELLNDNLKK